MTLRVIVIAAFITAAAAATATAQTNGNPFGLGTTLAGFAGGTTGSDGTAPAAGLELGWEILPHLTVEGTTLWSMPGDGRHEFGVLIGPKFNLVRGRPRVPFITAGVGMYRASFDTGASAIPAFYADRMTNGQAVTSQTFDDFVASIGGGAEFFLHQHWAVRPDVRVMMITGDSNSRWITAFGAHIAYHFERHRISD
jgi:hypothetical protein